MQQIFKGETNVPIHAYPSDLSKQWSRAFVRVQTPSTAMPDDTSWDLATIDTFIRTTTGTAKEGTHTINFSPVGPIVSATEGNFYVVDTADQEPNFIVQVSRVISATQVEVQDPLPQDIPTGSSVRGFRVSHELTAAEVKNEGQCIARWRVENRDRIQYIWDEPFLIVNTHTNYALSSAELERIYPLVLRLRPEDQTLNEIIEAAWITYMRPDLEAKGIKPNQIKSWERLNPAHAAACVYHLVVTDERQDEMFREQWRTLYAHQLDLLFASVFFWYDDSDGDTPGISDMDFRQRTIYR